MIEPSNKHAVKFSDSLRLAEDGIWYADNHMDFAFLEEDDTDWARLQEVSFWYQHRAKVFIEVINRFPPKGSIYEIGAGDGSVSITLQNNGYEVVAIEPTVRCAKMTKQRGAKNVICSTIENAKFDTDQLSNVGLFDVLEHIPNDIELLSRIRKLMPVGGRLYCSVPAYNVLWSKEDEYAGHFQRYTLKKLCNKIENSGFSIEYGSYFFRPLVLPILLFRAIPTALGVRSDRTPENSEREHCPPKGLISIALNKCLEQELSGIANGKSYKFGASCLLVAKAC